MPNPAPSERYENRFRNVKRDRHRRPAPGEFHRPLLMSIELSRPMKSCCCSRTTLYPSHYPCPQCNPNEIGPYSRHPAYLNNLTCTGSNSCGSCATGNAATCSDTGPCGQTLGNQTYSRGPIISSQPLIQSSCYQTASLSPSGSCNAPVNTLGGGGGTNQGGRCARLPGQGPCDPPCFSTMIFPRYTPFVTEPKCQPHPIVPPVISDGCSGASVGGSSMYGAFTRSSFSCNNCGVPGQVDVCNLPYGGCNNAACSSPELLDIRKEPAYNTTKRIH